MPEQDPRRRSRSSGTELRAEARRRGLGTRRERIGPIIARLATEHGDAEIALRFGSDVELLISVMLSAQTTDVNVNRVTEKLFVKYRGRRTTWLYRRRSSSRTSSRPASTGRRRSRSAAR